MTSALQIGHAHRAANPTLPGRYVRHAVAYFEDTDTELDVIVSFDIDGPEEVCVQSVHPDLGAEGWGHDIFKSLDAEQLDSLRLQCIDKVEWRGK